jgi:hypothetical protein
MNAKDALRKTMDSSLFVLKTYVSDLTDADLLRRPGPGCNHLAWQLGHLIASESQLLNSISPGAGGELPVGFVEQHSKDTIGVDDPKAFCTKQQYLDLFDKVRAATKAALDKFPDADFEKPSPEGFRKMFPTMGDLFTLIATHPMMHAGQVVPVRRALGKPVVI